MHLSLATYSVDGASAYRNYGAVHASGPGLTETEVEGPEVVEEFHTWPLPHSKVSQQTSNNVYELP